MDTWNSFETGGVCHGEWFSPAFLALSLVPLLRLEFRLEHAASQHELLVRGNSGVGPDRLLQRRARLAVQYWTGLDGSDYGCAKTNSVPAPGIGAPLQPHAART